MGIVDDERPIAALVMGDMKGTELRVGMSGVTKIKPYKESMNDDFGSLWFEVFEGDKLLGRASGDQVAVIYYQDVNGIQQ